MNPTIENALLEIYAEKQRLEKSIPKTSYPVFNAPAITLPKRNLKLKFTKLWHSKDPIGLAFKFGRAFILRLKLFQFLRLIFTFPAELRTMQKKIENLELQLLDHRVKIIQLSKSLEKNSFKTKGENI